MGLETWSSLTFNWIWGVIKSLAESVNWCRLERVKVYPDKQTNNIEMIHSAITLYKHNIKLVSDCDTFNINFRVSIYNTHNKPHECHSLMININLLQSILDKARTVCSWYLNPLHGGRTFITFTATHIQNNLGTWR